MYVTLVDIKYVVTCLILNLLVIKVLKPKNSPNSYHHLIFIAIEISWPHWGSRGRIGEDPSLGRRWVVGVRHCVPDRYNHHKTWRWRWPLLLQCWCWWLYDGFDILIMHANENMYQICVIILFDAIIYLHQIRLTLAVPQGHNRG